MSGKPIPVEPQVFDLLVYLIVNRNRVVSREELFDSLWKGKVVTDATLGVRLKDVRKAIGDSGDKQAFVKTIRGRGYQFVGKIEESPTASGKTIIKSAVIGQSTEAETENQPSIVVLPFSNLGQNPADDYFIDSLTDDITVRLSH